MAGAGYYNAGAQSAGVESEQAESNARIVSLMERVDNLTEKATSLNVHTDVVAFVGPTKAGKSTLINGLMGVKLVCVKDPDYETTSIRKAREGAGPKIGEEAESQTAEPEGYGNIPYTPFAMWDFAGFGDNKGTEQQVINAISYQTILGQRSVRFVLVIPFSMISAGDFYPFFKLMSDLQGICAEVAESLCIVVTKHEKGNVENVLKKRIADRFDHSEKDNVVEIRRGQRILEKIVEKKQFVEFGAPKMEDGVYEDLFELPNKTEIVACIKALKGTTVQKIPLFVGEQAKKDIGELYASIFQILRHDARQITEAIGRYVQTRIEEIHDGSKSAVEKHKSYIEGKRKVVEIANKSHDFSSFFEQIRETNIVIAAGFDSGVKKFNFLERLRNSYKLHSTDKTAQGEKECFLGIKMALNKAMLEFSNLIETSKCASEEEKERERAWKRARNLEIEDLKAQINELIKENDSTIVQNAKKVAKWIRVAKKKWNEAECVVS